MINVGCFTSVYFNNIGNAFIDFGAIATTEAALPEGAQVVKVSQFPNFASSMARGILLKESPLFSFMWRIGKKMVGSKFHDKSYSLLSNKQVFNLAELARLDVLIVPGCVLTVPFFSLYFNLLKRISDKGTKIVFLGASGNYYSENEVKEVTSFLNQLKPAALLFRDPQAYNLYKDLAPVNYNGIDNAFFVNKLKLPKVDTYLDPFVVLNFDDPRNFNLNKKLANEFKNVIYTDHKPFPLKYVKRQIDRGIMVSDTPLDYLFLYSNAQEVHSDRVHACIPTLSYGNKCKIYSDSPRIKLFENVGVSNTISKELTVVKDLESKQNAQIKVLADVLRTI